MTDFKSQKIKYLQKCLKIGAILLLKKYNPRIVSITGSVGKTSTKEAIFCVLAENFRVRRSEKNYNNEIGLPLTIIGSSSGNQNIVAWLKVFFKWLAYLILPLEYPEILILEMGADRPDDIKYLTEFVHSEVGVITEISASHIEFFKNQEGIIQEKGILVRGLIENGLAVLNADNNYVMSLRKKIKAKITTFGFSESADIRANDPQFFYEIGGQNERILKGLTFKLNYAGKTLPVRLNNILGKHQIYPMLAAAVVGNYFGINLVQISSALSNVSALPGRMNLMTGIKNSLIIDDSYNASPVSAQAAIETMAQIQAPRKIIVLGDMLELGSESEAGHRKVAREVFKLKPDLFMAIGAQMEVAVNELKSLGYPEEKVFYFDDLYLLGKKLQQEIQSGDLILVKGSQGMRMEKVVEEIMGEPIMAETFLCRQSQEWKK